MSQLATKIRELLHHHCDPEAFAEFVIDNARELIEALEAVEKLPKRWMIWSNEHGAWWKADSKGYSVMLADAGHYSFDDAVEICRGANFSQRNRPNFHNNASPPETMVPVPQPLSPSGGEKP